MRHLFVFFLLFCGFGAGAQTVLSGIVKDNTGSTPLEYATLSLYRVADHKLLDGATTDSTGQYHFTGIVPGRYTVKAVYLGYKPLFSDTFSIIADLPSFTLPDLLLTADGQNLQTVNITAQAQVVENRPDKMIYHASNDVTAQGGVAIDLLKKVPQVTVDADGNVELQGNPNIRFLINGKPSGIFGSSLNDALATIPASQIKSIEVISSPGARYDAQGTGGVINIIFKDSPFDGLNGSVSLAAGTRLENGAFNMDYRSGKVSVNVFANGNAQLNSRSLNSQQRQSAVPGNDGSTQFSQDGYTDIVRKGLQAGAGLNWDLQHGNNFSASLQYSSFSNKRSGRSTQREIQTLSDGTILSDQYSNRNAASTLLTTNLDWSLGYQKQFARKGTTLELLYTASMGKPDMSSSQAQFYPNEVSPYNGNRVNNPGKDQQHNISLDYTYTFSEHLKLETGAKYSFQHINSINEQQVFLPGSDQYLYAPGLSYNLNYDLSVYAAYASTTMQLWHWLDLSAGLRLEHTGIQLDYNNTHIPAYTTLLPSVLFSHRFKHQQTLKLSYSRRLERPEYEELNPFLNLSDPYNITTGNPYLKPEMGNNIELGYGRSFDNGIDLYAALSERINSNDVKPFTAFYPVYNVGDSSYTNVSVTDKRNIGVEYNSGIILSGSVPIKQLGLRSNIMLTHKHIVNDMPGANPVTNTITARISLNASYSFPFGLLAEATGNYRSAFTNIQGRQPGLVTYTFAVRKQFANKKASVGLTATNIFSNFVNQETTVNTPGYTSVALRQLPFRSAGLTFSYKFGKQDSRKKDKQGISSDNIPSEN